MKAIKATELKPGYVLALPFGKTATIRSTEIGTKYVTMHFVEPFGAQRVGKDAEVLIEEG